MKILSSKIAMLFTLLALVSGCARDLSSDMYTSDSTLSFTLEGVIVAARPVKIKDTDKMGNNTGVMLAGGAMGAALGSGVGGGSGATMAVVGGAIAGGLAGAAIQGKLGESKGFEYIVKVDASKIKDGYYDGNASIRNAVSTARAGGLVTVVQGADNALGQGQRVYVIYSENRTRVVPAY
jgi:outer membrane lipoprotein SlyB